VLDSGTYRESSWSAWLAKAPQHFLANSFGIAETALANVNQRMVICAPKAPT